MKILSKLVLIVELVGSFVVGYNLDRFTTVQFLAILIAIFVVGESIQYKLENS